MLLSCRKKYKAMEKSSPGRGWGELQTLRVALKEDPSELLVIERRCTERRGMRWDFISRRNREAAPGQSTRCAPEQWSRPCDTSKLLVAQEDRPAAHSHSSAVGHMGIGKRQGVAEPWPGPLVHFPMPFILTTVRARTVLLQREEAHGWEQRWGDSLACDCGQGGRQGQQQGRVPPWAMWDPLDEGRWHDVDMCCWKAPAATPCSGEVILEMRFIHTIFYKTHITNKTSALSTFSTFREFSGDFPNPWCQSSIGQPGHVFPTPSSGGKLPTASHLWREKSNMGFH